MKNRCCGNPRTVALGTTLTKARSVAIVDTPFLLSILAEVLQATHEGVARNVRDFGRTIQVVLLSVHLQSPLERGHDLHVFPADHLVDCHQVLKQKIKYARQQ